MKKLIIFSLLLAVVLMTACYDDYTSDYEYTAAYFSYQYPIRTVIIDPEVNSFDIKVGATYGGRYSYEGQSETVNFVIADTLITNHSEYADMGIKVMPSSWYTLSNQSVISITDSNVGSIDVSINKDSLTNHPDATQNTYVIPFLATGASTDSILAGKDFSLVMVKFKNEFDGRYYVKGVDNTLDLDGNVVSSAVYSNPALVLNKYIFLNSTSKSDLSVPRIGGNENKSQYVYNMNVRASDGAAVLTPVASSVVNELVGVANYNFAEKTFVCNYNYKLDGIEHSVIDTLIYSNTELILESWK